MHLIFKKAKLFFLFCKAHPRVDLILILLVGLHIFSGLHRDLLYIGGDTGIPLNPIKNLQLLYLWQNQQSGMIWWNLTSAFMYAFFAFFKILGVSLAIIQRFYIYFAHALAGLSMYYLVTSFPLEKKRIAATTAAIFYMFSPFLINYLGIFVLLPYTIMPLILGVFVRGLSHQMNIVKCALFVMVAFFGIIINLPSYTMYFVAFLLMGLYAIFYVSTNRGESWHLVRFVFGLSVLIVLLSLWFVPPYLSLLSQTGVADQLRDVSIAPTIEGFGDYGYSTLLHLIRMFGAAGFMAGGATYSLPYLNNPLLLFVSYVIPLLVFGGILLKPRSKEVLFFSIVSIVFIFLAKGVNPPFGKLHFWIVTHMPLARTFRTTWNLSLGANVGYSFLIGVTTASIVDRFMKQGFGSFKAAGAVILILGVILTNAWPLLSGAYFTLKWNPPNFEGVRVPKAYYELDDFLANDRKEDSRFLKIPSNGGMTQTSWGYSGGDPFFSIFSKPFINSHSLAGSARQINSATYDLFDQVRPEDKLGREIYSKTLALLNVRYIVLDGHDKDSKDLFTYKNRLNIQLGIRHLRDIGKFSIYEIWNNRYFLPHIYAANTLTYGQAENGGVLLSILSFTLPRAKNAIFLPGFQKRQDTFALDKTGISKGALVLIVPSSRKSRDGVSQEQSGENLVEIGNKYRFQVPKTAKYSVLIRKNSFLGQSKNLQVFFGKDSKMAASPLLNGENKPAPWVKLGNVFLEKGKHPLRIVSSGLKVNVMNSGDLVLKTDNSHKNLNPPKIHFKKINPTKYVVNVSEAKDPYHLVFLESFHKGWKAYVKPGTKDEGRRTNKVWETWFKKPISEDKHFLVNGYANDWYVEPKDAGQRRSYQVILEFWPQRLFYLGLGISSLTLITCLIYLVYIWVRAKKIARNS